jgi:hypothetical protein
MMMSRHLRLVPAKASLPEKLPPLSTARREILRHVDSLQILALNHPRIAKAILRLTERMAHHRGEEVRTG